MVSSSPEKGFTFITGPTVQWCSFTQSIHINTKRKCSGLINVNDDGVIGKNHFWICPCCLHSISKLALRYEILTPDFTWSSNHSPSYYVQTPPCPRWSFYTSWACQNKPSRGGVRWVVLMEWSFHRSFSPDTFAEGNRRCADHLPTRLGWGDGDGWVTCLCAWGRDSGQEAHDL